MTTHASVTPEPIRRRIALIGVLLALVLTISVVLAPSAQAHPMSSCSHGADSRWYDGAQWSSYYSVTASYWHNGHHHHKYNHGYWIIDPATSLPMWLGTLHSSWNICYSQ